MSIFDRSTLYAHFKDSLVLDKGSGNPSFTRTTTKKVFNYDGILIDVPIGAAAFPAARLVANNISAGSSEDITSTGWTYEGATASANAFTQSTGSGYVSIRPDRNEVYVVNRTYLIQYRVEYVDWQFVGITPAGAVSATNDYANFDIVNGIVNNIGAAEGFIRHVSGNIYDISLRFVCDASGSDSGLLYQGTSLTYTKFDAFARDNSSSVNVYKYITTDISYDPTIKFVEFVSSGVESDPWHGAGVDGAQWFGTEANGTNIPNEVIKGVFIEPAATNSVLYCRDATNVAWAKTNITAALDETGLDNVSSTASSLEATAGNGTCFQTITLAAATRTFSVYVKRLVGTGTIQITRDGGSTYTDITSLINSSTFTRVYIRGTSVLNPQVGFRIVTSGDKIAFDYTQDESGSIETSPIYTTSASATRNADSLTYQTSGNFNDTEGAIYASIVSDDWPTVSGNIGSATTGLAVSSSNSGVQALDGTNTVNGPTGSPLSRMGLAIGWDGSTLRTASEGESGTAGSYDGSFNLSNIDVGVHGYIKYLNIWTTALTQGELDDVSRGIELWKHHLPPKYELLVENISLHPDNWTSAHVTPTTTDGPTLVDSGSLFEYTGSDGSFRFAEDGSGTAVTIGQKFIYSYNLKYLTQRWIALRLFGSAAGYSRHIDLQNMVLGSGSTNSAVLTVDEERLVPHRADDGWYTLTIKVTMNQDTSLRKLHYWVDDDAIFTSTGLQGNQYYTGENIGGILNLGNINWNDVLVQFFSDNGFPTNYNDGMLAWLRSIYGVGAFQITGSTLNDLYKRYRILIQKNT